MVKPEESRPAAEAPSTTSGAQVAQAQLTDRSVLRLIWPWVYLEGQPGGIYLHGSEEVARYTLAFEHLRAAAFSPAATMSLIEEVAAST